MILLVAQILLWGTLAASLIPASWHEKASQTGTWKILESLWEILVATVAFWWETAKLIVRVLGKAFSR